MWPAPSLSSLEEVVECAKRRIGKPHNSQGRPSIDTTTVSHRPGPSTSTPTRRKSILKQPSNPSLQNKASVEATPTSPYNWSSPRPQQYQLATSPLIEVIITRHEPVGTQCRLADLKNRQDLHWPSTSDFAAATGVGNGASVSQSVPRALAKDESRGGSAASILSTSGEERDFKPGSRVHNEDGRDGLHDESDYVVRVS